jgi:hypothetical protein
MLLYYELEVQIPPTFLQDLVFQSLPCLFLIKIFKIGIGGGVQLGPLGTAATIGLLCQPRDVGEVAGMIGRGNRSTRRKPAPVPLCPPQTRHAARTRTRAAAVGSQRLTAELRHGVLPCLIRYPHNHGTKES